MRVSGKHFLLVGLCAALLRIVLWVAVPPTIMYDDHFQPAKLMVLLQDLPQPHHCFECFQPPVFYLISAAFLKVGYLFTANQEVLDKIMQLVTLLFGLGMIPLVRKFLSQLNFSKLTQLLAFATFCFLPRHIFMSVTHSNDSAVYFFVTAAIVSALAYYNSGFKIKYAVFTALLASLAVLTKSTAVILFPAIFLLILFKTGIQNWRKTIVRIAMILVLPLGAFAGHIAWKSQFLENPMAMNLEILGVDIPQRPGHRSLVSFTPWENWENPLIHQKSTESLPTTLFAQFWYESEPKISSVWLNDMSFNHEYQMYINYRNLQITPDWSRVPAQINVYGRLSLVVGFAIASIFVVGFVSFIIDVWKRRKAHLGWVFFAMLFTNLLGIGMLTGQYPMYSFMKAAFLLPSAAALIYFLCKGFEAFPKKLKSLSVGFVGMLLIYSTVYSLHLAISHLVS
ncbi:ArnT family glycosyltransferase [Halocola ammonii]